MFIKTETQESPGLLSCIMSLSYGHQFKVQKKCSFYHQFSKTGEITVNKMAMNQSEAQTVAEAYSKCFVTVVKLKM